MKRMECKNVGERASVRKTERIEGWREREREGGGHCD